MQKISLKRGKLESAVKSTYIVDREKDFKVQYAVVGPIKLVPTENIRLLKQFKTKKKNLKQNISKTSPNFGLQDYDVFKIDTYQINRTTDKISARAIRPITKETSPNVSKTSTKLDLHDYNVLKIHMDQSDVATDTSSTKAVMKMTSPMTITSPTTLPVIATLCATTVGATMSKQTTTAKANVEKIRNNKNMKKDFAKSGQCKEWKTPFKSFITTGVHKRNIPNYFAYDLSGDELKNFITSNVPMKPASAFERQLLSNGERLLYLNQRYEHLPSLKYNYPEATSWRIGWLHSQRR